MSLKLRLFDILGAVLTAPRIGSKGLTIFVYRLREVKDSLSLNIFLGDSVSKWLSKARDASCTSYRG